MLRFDEGFEFFAFDHPGTGRAMIAAGELHVVNVKAVQPFGHRFEMHGVIDEAQVVFDLGVTAIVPVADGVVLKFGEE